MAERPVEVVERRDAEAPQPPSREPADDERDEGVPDDRVVHEDRDAVSGQADIGLDVDAEVQRVGERLQGVLAVAPVEPGAPVGEHERPSTRATAVVLVDHAGHARAPRRSRRGSCAASR